MVSQYKGGSIGSKPVAYLYIILSRRAKLCVESIQRIVPERERMTSEWV